MSHFKPCRVILEGNPTVIFASPRVAFPMSVILELHGTSRQIEEITGDPKKEKIKVRIDMESIQRIHSGRVSSGMATLVGYLLGEPTKLVWVKLDLVNGRGRIERLKPANQKEGGENG